MYTLDLGYISQIFRTFVSKPSIRALLDFLYSVHRTTVYTVYSSMDDNVPVRSDFVWSWYRIDVPHLHPFVWHPGTEVTNSTSELDVCSVVQEMGVNVTESETVPYISRFTRINTVDPKVLCKPAGDNDASVFKHLLLNRISIVTGKGHCAFCNNRDCHYT